MKKRQGDNYFWGHKEDVIFCNNSYALKEFKLYRKKFPIEKSIEQYDLDGNYIQSYTSITNVAKMFNGTRQNITRAIKSNSTAYGYRWKYAR